MEHLTLVVALDVLAFALVSLLPIGFLTRGALGNDARQFRFGR